MQTDPLGVSKNLDSWRFVLIAFVVLNHAFLMAGDTLGSASMSALDYAISAITRSAVPALSVFSGYLFASSERSGVLTLIARKTESLIIPFLVWNTAAFVALLVGNEVSGLVPSKLIQTLSRYDLVNSATGFHSAPANAPLYFIRDLFICFLIFAAISPLLRRPVGFAVALAAMLANYAYELDGRIFIRDTIPLFFLIGLGLRSFPGLARSFERVTGLLPVGAALAVVLCAIFQAAVIPPSVLHIGTCFILAALLLAIARRMKPNRRLSAWGRDYSYIIFLSHWWVLQLLYLVWQPSGLDDWAFELLSSSVAILVGVGIARLVPLLPEPLAWAVSGGRIRSRTGPAPGSAGLIPNRA